jgi:hypothetical protein
MAELVWMSPGVEPRSSRMWLVALRTETFRLHAHQSGNESNRKAAHSTATHVRCTRYLVLGYGTASSNAAPGIVFFHSTCFIILRSTFLLFPQRWLEERNRDLKAFLLPGSKS